MAVYCAGCGNSLAPDARFCSACGKAVVEGGFASPFNLPASRDPQSSGSQSLGPLVRPLLGRKIAGVCQGFANHYGWDVTLTRVIAVLLTIAIIPFGLIAYILFWVFLPQEPQVAVAVNNLNPTS